MNDNKNTILLNWDTDAERFFLEHLEDWSDVEGAAKAYLDTYYKDTGIGDLIFCILCQYSVMPSRVFTDMVSRYHCREEGGIPVDYSESANVKYTGICHEQHGVYPTKVWIEHCKEIGIRPWISLRMNDCHDPDAETSVLRSEFFYEAKTNGWMLGEEYGYFRNCFNYAIPQVRQKFLDYLEEQLSVLDVYGVELDFMREPLCFDVLHKKDAAPIMNEFMEKAKAIVSRCEAIHGHPIKVMVRLPRDIHLCLEVGFDAVYWACHGLVDSIVPTGRFRTTDTGMPIAEWVEMLSPYGVEVYAGLEALLPSRVLCRLQNNLETAKGHTAQYAAQGSARTYLYNIYHPYLASPGGIWETPEVIKEIWATIGDPIKCTKGVRRHMLTFDDTYEWFPGRRLWKPLPAAVGEGVSLEVQTGPITAESAITLYMAVPEGDAAALKVTFNGEACTYRGHSDKAWMLRSGDYAVEDVAAFTVPATVTCPVTQTVFVSGDPAAEIHALELAIDAG